MQVRGADNIAQANQITFAKHNWKMDCIVAIYYRTQKLLLEILPHDMYEEVWILP